MTTHKDKFFPEDLPTHTAEYTLVQIAQFISVLEDSVAFRFGANISYSNSTYSYQIIAINISITPTGRIAFNSFDPAPDRQFIGGGRQVDHFIAKRGKWEVDILKTLR